MMNLEPLKLMATPNPGDVHWHRPEVLGGLMLMVPPDQFTSTTHMQPHRHPDRDS